MRKCLALWDERDQKRIRLWWTALQSTGQSPGTNRSGWRAELRRAETPTDALLSQGFRALYSDLSGTRWTDEENILGLAAVAGVLAHIDVNDETHSFVEMCAISREDSSGPPVSEMRFSQLQKSRTLEELFTRMRRTIHMLRRKTNVISTADSILHWYRETEVGDVNVKPRERVLVRWGLDYFQQLARVK